MKAELGVVKMHPLRFAWKLVTGVLKTWRYAKKNGFPCNEWYGVYEEGTEIVLAQTGPLPGAKERAQILVKAMDCALFPQVKLCQDVREVDPN